MLKIVQNAHMTRTVAANCEINMKFEKYPKINSVFKRDERGNFMIGEWSTPEFELLQNIKWDASEKIDGTNIRIRWNASDNNVIFGGRTDKSDIPKALLEKLHSLFNSDMFQHVFAESGELDVILFGEGYGNRIQKVGRLYIPDGVDFILFDVKIGNWWLRHEDVAEIAHKLGIQSVPPCGKLTLNEAIEEVRNGVTSAFGEFSSEGFVMKLDLLDRAGKRLMTKVKVKDFQ